MKRQKIKNGFGNGMFDVINMFLLGIISLVMLFPFIHVVAASFTSVEEYLAKDFILFPTTFSLESYKYIFSTGTIVHGLLVSAGVTIVGTALNLLMCILTAYPLAHKNLVGRKTMILLVIFTLMFNGGMVPMFIVVQKLRLLNSYASLILPYVISSFNLMLFKNYFQGLPQELEESARIDGYNDLSILFKIILPLSKPLLATFTIIFGVEHWNSWFNAMLYLSDSNKWPIQVILRQIVLSASEVGDAMGGANYIPPVTVRMCTIVVATIPILCIYPFLQKYFTKGILMGSVKG